MTDAELIKQWDDYVESMGSVMGEVEHMAKHMRDRIDTLVNERDAAIIKYAGWELEAKILRIKLAKAVEAIETLNSACDAMWNDHEPLEENPERFGQDYRLKEIHMRAISEAQQKLPSILAKLETKL